MKKFIGLIFVSLILLSTTHSYALNNESFIRIKLQQVELLEILNTHRLSERKYLSKLVLMDINFDMSKIDDIKKLRYEYGNLISFKNYLKTLDGYQKFRKDIDRIFEKNYLSEIQKIEEDLLLKKIAANSVVPREKHVEYKSEEGVSLYITLFFGLMLVTLGALYQRNRQSLKKSQDKNRRISLVNIALKKSKNREFLISKGDKVIYTHGNIAQEYKTVSSLEEDYLSLDEYNDVLWAGNQVERKYFESFDVSEYTIYDLRNVDNESDKLETSSRFQISSEHSA